MALPRGASFSQTNTKEVKLENLGKKYSNMMLTNFFPVKDGFVLIHGANAWSINQELIVFKGQEEKTRINFVMPSQHGGFISSSDTSSHLYYVSQSTESKLANITLTKFDTEQGTSEFIALPGVQHLFEDKSESDIFSMEYCFMMGSDIYIEFSQKKELEDKSILYNYYFVKFNKELSPSGVKLNYNVKEKEWMERKCSLPRIVDFSKDGIVLTQLYTSNDSVSCHLTSLDPISLEQSTIVSKSVFPELKASQLTTSKRVDRIHGSYFDNLKMQQNFLRFEQWSFHAGARFANGYVQASAGTRFYTLNSTYHCKMFGDTVVFYGLSKKKGEADQLWSTTVSIAGHSQMETQLSAVSGGKETSHIKGVFVNHNGVNIVATAASKVYYYSLVDKAFSTLTEPSKNSLLNFIPSIGYSLETSLALKGKFSEGVDKIRVVSSGGHTYIGSGAKGTISIVSNF